MAALEYENEPNEMGPETGLTVQDDQNVLHKWVVLCKHSGWPGHLYITRGGDMWSNHWGFYLYHWITSLISCLLLWTAWLWAAERHQ